MKTIQFSIDRAEWTRYYYSIEVADDATNEQIAEQAREAVEACDARECGTKFIGNAEMYDEEYRFPWEGL
jgi:hypothetical protein